MEQNDVAPDETEMDGSETNESVQLCQPCCPGPVAQPCGDAPSGSTARKPEPIASEITHFPPWSDVQYSTLLESEFAYLANPF